MSRNTGRWLEDWIEAKGKEHHHAGEMTLEKVAPPTRIIRKFGKVAVINLANPFLDFVGTLPNGRAVMIEAKSTTESLSLPINRDGGVTEKQVEALNRWQRWGAVCFVVWGLEQDGEKFLCAITLPTIWGALNAGRKSVKWSEGEPIPDNDLHGFALAIVSRMNENLQHDNDSPGY